MCGLGKDDEYSTGKLTITAEDTSASLKAYGGQNSAGIGGGSYDSTSKLEIANGKSMQKVVPIWVQALAAACTEKVK